MRVTKEGFVAIDQTTLDRLAFEASLDEDSCCSFQEWSDAGFHVNKGARSIFKDALGVPQFTKEQVTQKQIRKPQ